DVGDRQDHHFEPHVHESLPMDGASNYVSAIGAQGKGLAPPASESVFACQRIHGRPDAAGTRQPTALRPGVQLAVKRFDAIVIRGGQAGPSMAGRLAAAGMTVAVVERHLFGGTCVNSGCTPTKTMVASAYAAHLARRAGDFGVRTGPVSVDMTRV